MTLIALLLTASAATPEVGAESDWSVPLDGLSAKLGIVGGRDARGRATVASGALLEIELTIRNVSEQPTRLHDSAKGKFQWMIEVNNRGSTHSCANPQPVDAKHGPIVIPPKSEVRRRLRCDRFQGYPSGGSQPLEPGWSTVRLTYSHNSQMEFLSSAEKKGFWEGSFHPSDLLVRIGEVQETAADLLVTRFPIAQAGSFAPVAVGIMLPTRPKWAHVLALGGLRAPDESPGVLGPGGFLFLAEGKFPKLPQLDPGALGLHTPLDSGAALMRVQNRESLRRGDVRFTVTRAESIEGTPTSPLNVARCLDEARSRFDVYFATQRGAIEQILTDGIVKLEQERLRLERDQPRPFSDPKDRMTEAFQPTWFEGPGRLEVMFVRCIRRDQERGTSWAPCPPGAPCMKRREPPPPQHRWVEALVGSSLAFDRRGALVQQELFPAARPRFTQYPTCGRWPEPRPTPEETSP